LDEKANPSISTGQASGVKRRMPRSSRSGKQSKGCVFAHPYALQENFTGRLAERQMLSDWFLADQRPVLAIVAMGGMGKSALAWVWLLRDVLDFPLPGPGHLAAAEARRCQVPPAQRPEQVLWWSFYDAEATFAAFVDYALDHLGDGSAGPGLASMHDKVGALVNLLQQRRLLLVLDGFERELRAYASLSAVYQGDSVTEDGQGEYRACTDIHAAGLLRWSCALSLKSRVLLTSRLLPLELDGLAGCRPEDLTAMAPDDAVAFFHAQGVKGTRAEIQAACEPCGYHPLTLRLLSGVITHHPTSPGDIAAVAGTKFVGDLLSREQHILAMAYQALRPPLQELLSRLAAFRSPVPYEVAALLNPFGGKRELGLGFTELADRGLIFFDRERWRYDLHPIIRAYAYQRLSDKERIHRQLRDYFATAPLPARDQIACLEDLAPAIELYHHSACAGCYDEAARLFHDHLNEPLFHLFGAYRTQIDLLRALFPNGHGTCPPVSPDDARAADDGLPALRDAGAQAWICNALASAYTYSGQLRQAIPLLKMHNGLQETLGDRASQAIGLRNLSAVQREMGELTEAERNLRVSIECSKQVGRLRIEATSRADLGRLLAYEGSFYEAEQQIEVAIQARTKSGHATSQMLSQIHRAQLALLMGIPRAALHCAELAYEQAEQAALSEHVVQPARNLVWVYWLLGVAHVELQRMEEAERFLAQALTRCRQINLVELEPDILLGWARWHRSSGSEGQALQCAEEAIAIASRSAYRLKEAEIRNFLAHCSLDASDWAGARTHAEKARERAWCDGPPHCYRLALDEAEGLLSLIHEQGTGGMAPHHVRRLEAVGD
jgi:tetratricopeptide (TPR) repeat protein